MSLFGDITKTIVRAPFDIVKGVADGLVEGFDVLAGEEPKKEGKK